MPYLAPRYFPGRYYAGRFFSGGSSTPQPAYFRQYLKRALDANADIVSVVGTNIYPLVATAGQLPALTYKIWRTKRLNVLTGPAGLVTARVRFESQSYRFNDCILLDEAIRLAFDGYTGILGGTGGPTVLDCFCYDERDEDTHLSSPPPDGSSGFVLKTRLDYTFKYRESIPVR